MQLETPFTRLLLRVDVDALAREVAQVPEERWRGHACAPDGCRATAMSAGRLPGATLLRRGEAASDQAAVTARATSPQRPRVLGSMRMCCSARYMTRRLAMPW